MQRFNAIMMATWCCSWSKQIRTYSTWRGAIQCWLEWSC